ncbi:hypothetical protein OH77DRAFT_1455429 [Trametes cingulata]|nr:hypothetical protein OH77DRAFT_1455429 [Trametes cingulata]
MRRLPPELLLLIGKQSTRFDLSSLVLAGSSMNELLTPLLYHTIELNGYSAMRLCSRTLSTPLDCLLYKRDLVGLVQAFHVLGAEATWHTLQQEQELEKGFSLVIPRLVNLRHFSFKLTGLLHSQVLIDFLASPPGQLRSLDVEVASDQSFDCYRDTIDNSELSLPMLDHLDSFRLVAAWDVSRGFFDFFRRLLAARSTHLCVLALPDSDDVFVKDVLTSNAPFLALQTLEVDSSTFFQPDFPHTAFPALSTLSLSGDVCSSGLTDEEPQPGAVPRAAYPMLEILRCHAPYLSFLLPKDAEERQRRKVHTVQLNDASYARNGGTSSPVAPEQEEVAEGLSHLPYSGVPIRHLSFSVHKITADNLATMLLSFKTLESLLVVADSEPNFELDRPVQIVSRMLAQMPHLHTLLFSDASLKVQDDEWCFNIAFQRERQRMVAQLWSQHAKALRRVAFTTEMEWVRRDGSREWVLITD